MKKISFLISSALSLSLIFSGCSSRTPTYKGKTQNEWEEMGVLQQYENALEQREESIEKRNALQRKCIDKLSYNRISAANACTSQLKALDKNIEYFNKVIENKREIVKGLEESESENDRQSWESTKDTMSTIFSWVLIGGLIYWASTVDPEEEKVYGY